MVILIQFVNFSCIQKKHKPTEKEKLESFFRKDEVTIAVTDSGLGGLSVMADALERMKEAKFFRRVDFVFFNALFSNESGYNSLITQEEKVHIFDSALKSLERNYQPDLILIGCNTLSALYEKTQFSRKTRVPVVGIIGAGTKLIAQGLIENADAKVILFATQTTISEASYIDELEKLGFPEERIVTKACPELVEYIEKGAESEETGMLISAYVGEALQKIEAQTPIMVSLNCTHYGYSLPLWKKAFEEYGRTPIACLNPNTHMADFLFARQNAGRFEETGVTASVVSMVEIGKEKIDSIGAWLRNVSPQTAEALSLYTLRENLFEWKKFTTSKI